MSESKPEAATTDAAALLAAAQVLAQQADGAASQSEAQRHLPAELVDAFSRQRIFHMCVPRAYGGCESSPADLVRVIETIARGDGSAGWCAMIGATSGIVTAYLPAEVCRTLPLSPASIFGGVYAPLGRARVCPGGFRLSGRWPFASGCQHCIWLMGGSLIWNDDKPLMLDNSIPDARLMLFPATAVEIHDTWDVSGLRGTGSHDISVHDLFVPASHVVSLIRDRPVVDGRLFAFPVFGLLALGIAAVCLGIARRAIDELTELAQHKQPSGSRRRLADRPLLQAQIAESEGDLRAARALVFETVAELWEVAGAGGIGIRHRALLRIATTHATHSAARVVDRMYSAGGGTAIYSKSPLQRCLRDIHVATQHTMVAAPTYELAGKVLLGIEADSTQL